MKYLAITLLLSLAVSASGQIYTTIAGDTHFISDAPLEVIEAVSTQMQGAFDLQKKTFAFKLYIKSFVGFNSPLQQVHFYENYMETSDYPLATFQGKIVEPIIPDRRSYRAKGSLKIHGKAVERIINVELNITDDEVTYFSRFTVPLNDHEIKLPRIVYQKIAEEIRVTVSGKMKRKA